MENIKEGFTLNNHVVIPCVGFGTWKMKDGNECEEAVLNALKCGYIHIDTAAAYGNEVSVGNAIKKSGIKRESLFITSKLWNDQRGYDNTRNAFNETLSKLGLDYLDLYLIHWPNPIAYRKDYEHLNNESWRAMEDLYKEGKIRAIGVCNFKVHHLEEIMKKATITPMINQIEYHIGYPQKEVVSFCKKNNILVEAWSPLGNGRIFKEEKMEEYTKKYHKSVAQLALRYIIQKNILPLPKSVTPSRIKENKGIFDFNIEDSDMDKLDTLTLDIASNIDSDQANF